MTNAASTTDLHKRQNVDALELKTIIMDAEKAIEKALNSVATAAVFKELKLHVDVAKSGVGVGIGRYKVVGCRVTIDATL